jgi:hypothetical protein
MKPRCVRTICTYRLLGTESEIIADPKDNFLTMGDSTISLEFNPPALQVRLGLGEKWKFARYSLPFTICLSHERDRNFMNSLMINVVPSIEEILLQFTKERKGTMYLSIMQQARPHCGLLQISVPLFEKLASLSITIQPID